MPGQFGAHVLRGGRDSLRPLPGGLQCRQFAFERGAFGCDFLQKYFVLAGANAGFQRADLGADRRLFTLIQVPQTPQFFGAIAA